MHLAKLSSRGFQTQTKDFELALALESCGGKLRRQATRAQIVRSFSLYLNFLFKFTLLR